MNDTTYSNRLSGPVLSLESLNSFRETCLKELNEKGKPMPLSSYKVPEYFGIYVSKH